MAKAPVKKPVAKKTAVKKPVAKKTKAAAKPTKTSKLKSARDLATERGEPYVSVLSVDIDPENVHNGAFELDWNDKFVANLVRAGYQMNPKDTDADIVDRWFTAVCRNVVLETYEQHEAMNPERDRIIKSRNLGDGRSEVS
jgi:hypothetical protein